MFFAATIFGGHGSFQEKYTYTKTHEFAVAKKAANNRGCRQVTSQLSVKYFPSSPT
jgi:hypothetical protein